MKRSEEDDIIRDVLGELGIDSKGMWLPLFTVNGVKFEVLAKIRAIRADGKMIENVISPIKLVETDDLYDAMLALSLACRVPEFQISPDELLKAAQEIATEIHEGKFKWTSPKKK
jgi:hypothetical protein